MPKYVNFGSGDMITETSKVTTGFFTGGIGTLAGSNLSTSSLATSQKNYYYNLQYSSEDQLSVTYGHIGGSGSDNVTNIKGDTEAIYKQFATSLLFPDDVETGFVFTGSTADNDVYVIVAERARMKDRMNKKNWTLHLKGSDTSGTDASIYLTDDSNSITATASPVGPRYNIVSGSDGTVQTTAANKTYGWFYPNVGVWVMRQSELSGSLPGTLGFIDSGSTYVGTDNGFAPELNNDATADNAWKLALALKNGTATSLRNEEDQVTKSYFCRAKAMDFNFSNNPTFTSGSDYELSQGSFKGNPQTFLTTVGLYNANQELVAVGKLSSPVKKNHSTEATIKVNLTY
jgi:hypothetical protein